MGDWPLVADLTDRKTPFSGGRRRSHGRGRRTRSVRRTVLEIYDCSLGGVAAPVTRTIRQTRHGSFMDCGPPALFVNGNRKHLRAGDLQNGFKVSSCPGALVSSPKETKNSYLSIARSLNFMLLLHEGHSHV